MGRNDTNIGTSNALRGGRALEIRLEVTALASPQALYETLADLPSHLEWAGKRAAKNHRLLTVDAPVGLATVGTEWASTGADPMGLFSDRSVVTEAVPGRVFEFVTEARQTPKRGGEPVEWTVVSRYEIARHQAGSRISYTERITSVSRLQGMMRLFATPLVGLIMRVAGSVSRRSLKNLSAVAQERTRASIS